MKILSLETGSFKLDGGALFGVVPKVLWQKNFISDNNNRLTIPMRSLLIDNGKRRILLDTGIGDKQDEKFFGIYEIDLHPTFQQSLAAVGYKPEDITDVVISHLHFDHCGGALRYDENKNIVPSFPNAQYHISNKHWHWAKKSNPLEKASFLKENFLSLEQSGQLNLIDKETGIIPELELRMFYGHTEGQIVSFIHTHNKTLVYIADVIPVAAHIPLPYICAYDIRPLISIEEKEQFLSEALSGNYTLFFEHDPLTECCNLMSTPKGIRAGKMFSLSEWKQC